jgi:hypothetical protein
MRSSSSCQSSVTQPIGLSAGVPPRVLPGAAADACRVGQERLSHQTSGTRIVSFENRRNIRSVSDSFAWLEGSRGITEARFTDFGCARFPDSRFLLVLATEFECEIRRFSPAGTNSACRFRRINAKNPRKCNRCKGLSAWVFGRRCPHCPQVEKGPK